MGREENVTSDSGSDARDGPGPRDSASPSRLGRMPCVNCHLCCQHPNFFRGKTLLCALSEGPTVTCLLLPQLRGEGDLRMARWTISSWPCITRRSKAINSIYLSIQTTSQH